MFLEPRVRSPVGLCRVDAVASKMLAQDRKGERRETPWFLSSSCPPLSHEFLLLSKPFQLSPDGGLESQGSALGNTEQGTGGRGMDWRASQTWTHIGYQPTVVLI